jgi:hypothetical protein
VSLATADSTATDADHEVRVGDVLDRVAGGGLVMAFELFEIAHARGAHN